jgi:hypothetical protein
MSGDGTKESREKTIRTNSKDKENSLENVDLLHWIIWIFYILWTFV